MNIRRSSSRQETEQELEKIIKDISILQLRVINLRSDLIGETDTEIELGDTVRITNNYKGQKGTVGTVIQITRTRVHLKTSEGKEIVRAQKNLEIISKTSNHSY